MAQEKLKIRMLSTLNISLPEVFSHLDLKSNGYLTPDDFDLFFRENNFYILSADLQILFQRYDKAFSGRIPETLFLEELTPEVVSRK